MFHHNSCKNREVHEFFFSKCCVNITSCMPVVASLTWCYDSFVPDETSVSCVCCTQPWDRNEFRKRGQECSSWLYRRRRSGNASIAGSDGLVRDLFGCLRGRFAEISLLQVAPGVVLLLAYRNHVLVSGRGQMNDRLRLNTMCFSFEFVSLAVGVCLWKRHHHHQSMKAARATSAASRRLIRNCACGSL